MVSIQSAAMSCNNLVLQEHQDKVVQEARRKFKTVILDVGGEKFSTLRKTLIKFPTSRLGRLMRADTVESMLELCDEFSLRKEQPPEFFFDKAGGWS